MLDITGNQAQDAESFRQMHHQCCHWSAAQRLAGQTDHHLDQRQLWNLFSQYQRLTGLYQPPKCIERLSGLELWGQDVPRYGETLMLQTRLRTPQLHELCLAFVEPFNQASKSLSSLTQNKPGKTPLPLVVFHHVVAEEKIYYWHTHCPIVNLNL